MPLSGTPAGRECAQNLGNKTVRRNPSRVEPVGDRSERAPTRTPGVEWRHADHKAYSADEDASSARHFWACHPRSSGPIPGAQRGFGCECWRDPSSSNGRHSDARSGPDGTVLPHLGLHSSDRATDSSRNRICSRHRGYFLVRRTTEPGARLTLVQSCELPWW